MPLAIEKRTFLFESPFGSTPLDPNELNGLIPSFIETQGELNQLEQLNIFEARQWARGVELEEVLSEIFLKTLHRRMFGNVWRWAGRYRVSDKSIGIAWESVREELAKFFANVSYWIEHQTYPVDELAARFHHRLVFIHPFSNGNGRHSRLMTDLLLEALGKKRFSWGEGIAGSEGTDLKTGHLRLQYISALKEADQRRFGRLLEFVRS